MKKLICMFLSLSLLCAPALALKGEVANPDDLPYIPSDGGPSSWAVSEVEAAMNAGLLPSLTGNPGFTDAITREQFAELVVQSVEVMLDREPGSRAKQYVQRQQQCVGAEGITDRHCKWRGRGKV